MRPFPAALVLGLAACVPACARLGNTPSGTPTATSRTVTMGASAVPAQPHGLLPSRVAVRPVPICGSHPTTVPKPRAGTPEPQGRPTTVPKPPAGPPDPQVSADPEAEARARRALTEANPPVPLRGPVRDPATAESCARTLRLELTLLTGGQEQPPQEPALRRTLTAMGLSGITVGTGSSFAASTGTDCVFGTFTAAGPELSIGPPTADGTCHG